MQISDFRPLTTVGVRKLEIALLCDIKISAVHCLVFTARRYASAVSAVIVCLSVRLSIRHKSDRFHGFLAVSVLFCSTVFLFSFHFIYFFFVYGAMR